MSSVLCLDLAFEYELTRDYFIKFYKNYKHNEQFFFFFFFLYVSYSLRVLVLVNSGLQHQTPMRH